MKNLQAFLILILFLSFFAGCQKELSLENPLEIEAEGMLNTTVSGDCTPMLINGTYRAGSNLGDTNYVDIEVVVTKPGAYNITTDIKNGYSFKASGNFATAGVNKVRLLGSGKPVNAGDDDFTVTFDSTSCFFSVQVIPGVPPPSGPAVFTLNGNPGNCLNFVLSGNYVKNVVLDASNKVTIEVDVTTAGTYSISTNTVNGMQFTASGVFAATGVQAVVLNGTGTPVGSGNSSLLVTAGSLTCSFGVTVTDTAPPVTNGDHFPLTVNSWWSYEDPASPGDTTKTTNITSKTIAPNTYRGFVTIDESNFSDTSYYRKSGNDYFEYALVDNYTSFTFDDEQFGEILFLKENLTTNATWESAFWTGLVSGQSMKLKYSFKCTNANATEVVNGKTYTNIYKVTLRPEIQVTGSPWLPTGEEVEGWYAKGVGLISFKYNNNGSGVAEAKIRYYQVF